MSKIVKSFFCIKEKKKYIKGENYTGDRTDLDSYVEYEKKEEKNEVLTKELKTVKRTKRSK